MYGLKNLKVRRTGKEFMRPLGVSRASQIYHLLKERCIGFIDTNQGLIIKDNSRLSRFKTLKSEAEDAPENASFQINFNTYNSGHNMSMISEGNTVYESFIKTSQINNDLTLQHSFLKNPYPLQPKTNNLPAPKSVYNFSTLSVMSDGSKIPTKMIGITEEGHFLDYLDKEMKVNRYTQNWQPEGRLKFSTKLSVNFVSNVDASVFLNLKNYWFKNLGKYFLAKRGNQRQFYYVCLSMHPKYLLRKYLSFMGAEVGVLRNLGQRMGQQTQEMIYKCAGIDISVLLKSLQERDDRLARNQKSSETKTTSSLENIVNKLPEKLISITKAKKNSLLILSSQNKSALCDSTWDQRVTFPDSLPNLGVPFSHLLPLVETPENQVNSSINIFSKSKSFDLKSGLGLGLNLNNFSNKRISILAKDFGIIAILDLLELILQVRIKHLKEILRQLEVRGELINYKDKLEGQTRWSSIKRRIQSKVYSELPKLIGSKDRIECSFTSLECFDDEYLLAFSNMPKICLYWELSRHATKSDIASFEIIGLQTLQEFQIIDNEISKIGLEFELETKSCNSYCFQQSQDSNLSEKSKSDSQYSDSNSSTKEENIKENSIESEDVKYLDDEYTLKRYVNNSILSSVVINTKENIGNFFTEKKGKFEIINERVRRVEQVEQRFKQMGQGNVEKLYLTGKKKFVNQMLKKCRLGGENVIVL